MFSLISNASGSLGALLWPHCASPGLLGKTGKATHLPLLHDLLTCDRQAPDSSVQFTLETEAFPPRGFSPAPKSKESSLEHKRGLKVTARIAECYL